VETDKIVKAALLTYLAWAWIDQGRDEEALEKLQEALELQRDRALTHALMAQALDNLGQPTEALEAWQNYINKYSKCNCRDKDIWMGKARKRLKGKSGTSPPNGNLD
jgi:Tfp pilus assembly protein PilF